MSLLYLILLSLLLVCLPALADEARWQDYSDRGSAAYKQGKETEAEQLLQMAVTEAREFGPADMRLARSLHNLAMAYMAQNKWPEAESALKEALSIKEKSLGPDDPDVARTLNNLGVAYFHQYEYKKAEACYQRVLAIDERSLSATHPERRTSLENYAALLHQTGRYKEAAPLEAQAATLRSKQTGGY